MKLTIAAALPLACAVPSAFAQPISSGLNQVIITAARSPEPLRAAIASVTVITAAQIERLQPRSVSDLLEGLAGISIARNGGLGTSTSVYLRGTSANQVLVLIDGIKVGSATTGAAAWEQIPVAQIARIVIVRGPYSSLYGSGAIGGVIEIFTRHGTSGAAPAPSLMLSGGSHGTYRLALGESARLGRGWYDISLSGLYTNGIPICAAAAPRSANCYTNSPQQGYWSGSAALSGGYRGRVGTVSADFLRSDGDTRYDGNIYSGDESRVAQQVIGGTLTSVPIGILTTSVTVGQSKDLSREYFNGAPDGFFDTTRDSGSWVNRLALKHRQRIVLGVDYERDAVASTTAYAVSSRRDVGEFGLYQLAAGHMELQLSGRHDQSQQFGGHDTWSAQWAYRLPAQIRLTASYGTAFKAPTFNDLYFPFYGDPTLRPETSRSAEIGLNGRTDSLRWSLNAYQTRIANLIEYDPVTFAAANVDRARIRGLEGRFAGTLLGWHYHLSLTALDPRDTGINNGKLLPRIARYSGRLDVDRMFGAVRFGATIFASAPRFEDPANTERLGGYETLDLRAAWHFRPHWRVQVLLANALGHRYETALYYNQPGRSAYLTLRYDPADRT